MGSRTQTHDLGAKVHASVVAIMRNVIESYVNGQSTPRSLRETVMKQWLRQSGEQARGTRIRQSVISPEPFLVSNAARVIQPQPEECKTHSTAQRCAELSG
jgi:hypothetical protein